MPQQLRGNKIPALLVGIIIFCGLFVPPAAGSVTAHRITSSQDYLTGYYSDGQINDYILENDLVAVVISDIDHVQYNANTGGNIIDAGASSARIDALGNLYTYFDNDWPRQAEYGSIAVIDDGSSGGPAVLRVLGVDSDNPSLTVVTDYSLAEGDAYVTLTTTVTNAGGSTYNNFELGDAFHWGGCHLFIPGYGFITSGNTTEAWLAGTDEEVSYGYTEPSVTLWGPNGSYWSDINVVSEHLGPGEEATYSRRFVVGGNDIASVASIAHEILEIPVGTVQCYAEDAAYGTPLPGAVIDVFDDQDVIYLQMEASLSGNAMATLPEGNWHLLASRDGYESDDAWLTISAGESYNVHFYLDSGGGPEIPAIGDTLTVIQRPLLNIPSIVVPGDTLEISCDAVPETSDWEAALLHGGTWIPLTVTASSFDQDTGWWSLSALIPHGAVYELYDLEVTAAGGIYDVTRNAVKLIPALKDDYYFVHVTDTHLPTTLYYYESGADTDTSEIVDFREVIEDIKIINPEFVLMTGDLINEGELEDFLYGRYYTRGQRLLAEFQSPVYLTAGNHDVGGWDATPPSAGTARRDWWRFFGWSRLNDPPPGAPWYTQNYSFDYGPVHYIGMEAYDNYDMWRSGIYGATSFTTGQLQWLSDDLTEAAGSSARVLFYHYDFANQIQLGSLGIEMGLWGHIHRDDGDIGVQPYDLSTNNVCDGERSFRLIRVSQGVLSPRPTISAGNFGESLTVQYQPANDGTHNEVVAEITNNYSEQFEHAQLRFIMPNGPAQAEVIGGVLFQVDPQDSVAVYYVNVDIMPNSFQTVTLSLSSSDAPGPGASRYQYSLSQNHPNPFHPRTSFKYSLPDQEGIRLSVYDLSGREIVRLVDRIVDGGEHVVVWDGRDRQGRPAADGIYFARLKSKDRTLSRKMILSR
ncbi:MAG: metallophosphoesterase [Candidatus Eisenbacteria bacterium]|uniref:Metallophosphoesterase n=1 Tax=Eiseniibacteriota bacterium TaxID=2212470 RepID=A0A948W8A1_UNCEI|nr:metallophosphoesterase [Candidatus Eisenbacteria bacterium]MBU2692486.1 metallophosphoesterase [Candidatus Eisenbacteria bacterium]